MFDILACFRFEPFRPSCSCLSSYIGGEGEVQEGTGDDESENADGADVAGVPGKVLGG